MASKTVLASNQPTIVSTPLLFSNSEITAMQTDQNKLEATDETDYNRKSPRAPRSNVESDESSDEMGQLVIDLDNDDNDKVDGNVKRSINMPTNNYQESPESSNNDIGDSSVITSTEDTISIANVSCCEITSVNDTSFNHLNKICKAKNKKASKLNKTKAHSPSLQSETPEIAKVAAVSDDGHVGESRLPVPSAGVSLDHSKKTKSSKTKNHKKQSRHAEKNYSSNGTIKSDSLVKTKIKSRHVTKNASDKTSAYITNTSEHHVLTQQDSNALSPALTLANKLDSSTRHISSLSDSDKPAKGRTPSRTALMPSVIESNSSFRLESKSKDSKNITEKEQTRKRHKRRQAPTNVDLFSLDTQNDFPENEVETAVMPDSFEIHSKRSKAEKDVKQNQLPSSEAGGPLEHARLFADSKPNSDESISSQTFEMLDKQYNLIRARKVSPDADNFKSSSTVARTTSSSTVVTSPKICAANAADINEKLGVDLHSSGRSKDEYKFTKGFEVSRQSVGTLTCTADIGVMTEPDVLGPCEPGTSVTLNGIVWQETETGVLVVNVTWRNRTYVGSLLDATKHDWDPPRFQDTESDFEHRGRMGRSQRLRGGVSDNTRKSRLRGITQYSLDNLKKSPSTMKRKNRNADSDAASDSSACRISSKRSRLMPSRGNKDFQTEANGAGNSSSPCSSPDLIECPHPTCCKRYRDVAGLKYHQSHAHGDVTVGSDETKANEKFSNSLKTEKSLRTEFIETQNDVSQDISGTDIQKNDDQQTELLPSPVSRLKMNSYDNHLTPISHQSNYNPDTTESVPVSTGTASLKTTQHSDQSNLKGPTTLTTNCDDYESAQAVQTLLQLQDTNNTTLPGLPMTRVQTSSHPTSNRPDPSFASYNLRLPMPPELLHSHLVLSNASSLSKPHSIPATSLFRPKSPHSARSLSTKRDSSPTPSEQHYTNRISTAVSTVFANGIRSSATVFQEGTKSAVASERFYPIQNSPSGFVSDSTVTTSGQKIVKGKVVPIPIDPEQSHAPIRNQSRGFEDKETKVSEPIRVPTVDNKSHSEIQRNIPSVFNSTSFAVVSASSRSAGFFNSQVVGNESSQRRSPFIPISESGAIIHSQGFVSKKVPGIILPVSSSGQNGNNVTVTGTFHPHPDPHQPQTNSSLQDGTQSGGLASLGDNLSNRNNSKLSRSQSSVAKHNLGLSQAGHATAPSSAQTSKPSLKPKFMHFRGFSLGLHDMMTIQTKVESAIADCYSAELANKRNAKVENESPPTQQPAIDSSPTRYRSEKTRSSEDKPLIENRTQTPAFAEQHKTTPRPQTKSPAEELAAKTGQSSFLPSQTSSSPHRSVYDLAIHQSAAQTYIQAMEPAFQNAFALAQANYAADPQHRERFEHLMQEVQKQQFLRHQHVLPQQHVNDKNRHRADAPERPSKPDPSTKNPGHIPSVFEKAHAWQQQQHGKASPATSSHYTSNIPKEKLSSPAVSGQSIPAKDVSNMRYKSPQPKISPAVSMPVRCHSVSQPNSLTNNKGFSVKTEPIRGRTLSKEVDQRPKSPLKIERIPPDAKVAINRPAASPNTKQGPIQYVTAAYPSFFDLRGIPPLPVPGLPPGYIFSPNVFPPGSWPPAVGRQSPIPKSVKQRVSVRTRSPVKEEGLSSKSEEKVADYSYQCLNKDKKPTEAPGLPFSKPSPSPDSRIVKATSLPSRKSRDSPSSSTQRAPSPPTQMHHHTHHHIHGVYQPPYPYPAAPVLAAPPEAVAATFAIPYPKRE